MIPADYARNVRRGVLAKIQLLVDGTNSNTATIALGYAGGIVAVANQQETEDEFVVKACGFSKREFERNRGSGSIRRFGRSTTWFRGSFACF